MYPAKCSIQSPRGRITDYGWLIVISLNGSLSADHPVLYVIRVNDLHADAQVLNQASARSGTAARLFEEAGDVIAARIPSYLYSGDGHFVHGRRAQGSRDGAAEGKDH
jgi:hypothetical protein